MEWGLTMLDALKPYNKAIVSALLAGLAMFLKVYVDDHSLSGDEWWQIVLAAAGGGGFTWLIPNAPKPTSTAEHRVE